MDDEPLTADVPGSALALFVPRILTDDPQHAFASDHLALIADPLDGSPDLHRTRCLPIDQPFTLLDR